MALSSAATPTQDAAAFNAVRIPPLETQLGSRVEHVVIQQGGLLSHVLAQHLQLPQQLFLELMRFGAVYYAPVMPKPAEKAPMSEQQLQAARAARIAGMQAWGPSPKLQVPRRVLLDQEVTPGGYARVHLQPKRFPVAYRVDWRARVLHVGPHCVVVDKPPGLQVPPTVDNVLESVPARTAAALGLPPGCLHGLHRLDAGTSGVVVLGRGDLGFTHWFTKMMGEKGGVDESAAAAASAAAAKAERKAERLALKARRRAGAAAAGGGGEGGGRGGGPAGAGERGGGREDAGRGDTETGQGLGSSDGGAAADAAAAPSVRVRKTYRAVTLARPPLGVLVHHALTNAHAPGEPPHTVMSRAATEGSARCEMEVLEVREIALSSPAAAEHGAAAFECDIRLVTGRTHQIRAQLAAEGCPLLGDLLYQAVARRQRQLQEEEGQQRQQQQQQQQQQTEGVVGEETASSGTEAPPVGDSAPFIVGADAAAWSRAAQADPLRPIGLQAARLSLFDPEGHMGAGQGHMRADGWVEFVAGTPWWRAEGADGGGSISSSGAGVASGSDTGGPPV